MSCVGVQAFLIVSLTLSCAQAGRDSTRSLIDQYRAAACLPLQPYPYAPDTQTRYWDTTIFLSDGTELRIKAAEMVGGMVRVTYMPSGESHVAANGGDYVYPADIRIDRQRERLYVVASGLAGGLWRRTLLFEYDLIHRRQTARRGVKERDVANPCPGSKPAQPPNRPETPIKAEDAIANGHDALRSALLTIPRPTAPTTASGQWRQRVPKSLHNRLVARARQEGVSLNTLVTTMIAEGLGRRKSG